MRSRSFSYPARFYHSWWIKMNIYQTVTVVDFIIVCRIRRKMIRSVQCRVVYSDVKSPLQYVTLLGKGLRRAPCSTITCIGPTADDALNLYSSAWQRALSVESHYMYSLFTYRLREQSQDYNELCASWISETGEHYYRQDNVEYGLRPIRHHTPQTKLNTENQTNFD